MMEDMTQVYETLRGIYQKHRRKHRENPDSEQMCCMWSTNNPPDIIEGTEPFEDIEAAFGIIIDGEEAYDLYDMILQEAAKRIVDLRRPGTI